jgi:hypothetical protein
MGTQTSVQTTCDTKDVTVGGEDLIITLGLSKKNTNLYNEMHTGQ